MLVMQALASLVQIVDPTLHCFLKDRDCLNYYFCYRWLLIHFKREFPFEQVCQPVLGLCFFSLQCPEGILRVSGCAILNTAFETRAAPTETRPLQGPEDFQVIDFGQPVQPLCLCSERTVCPDKSNKNGMEP